jgi:hypothetical protein
VAEHQVRLAAEDRGADAGEVAGVQRSVAVHEAHGPIARGEQPGPARRAEAANGLDDDERTELRGDPRGAVGGAVVDDDRAKAVGHAPQHPRQRGRLVKDREHHVGHDTATVGRRRQASHYKSLNTGLATAPLRAPVMNVS